MKENVRFYFIFLAKRRFFPQNKYYLLLVLCSFIPWGRGQSALILKEHYNI